MLGMGVWGRHHNAHAKVSAITKPPLDEELDALKAECPDEYAVLSEHFELDDLRRSPTERTRNDH